MVWALSQQDFTEVDRTHHVAKLVLLSLANHASSDTAICWPSVATIAREASCSPRHARRITSDLQHNGFIVIERSRGPAGRQGSNRYRLLMDRARAPWKSQSDATSPLSPE